MSGSEFERENIVMDALSAAPASKPDEALGEQGLREHSWRPPAEGLYDPSLERDSCGVGFIANIKGKKSRQIVSDAINILCNLEHRGAVGADPRAGDGAGTLEPCNSVALRYQSWSSCYVPGTHRATNSKETVDRAIRALA